jgi:hypothetical protein
MLLIADGRTSVSLVSEDMLGLPFTLNFFLGHFKQRIVIIHLGKFSTKNLRKEMHNRVTKIYSKDQWYINDVLLWNRLF